MKRHLLTGLLLLSSLATMADEPKSRLVVWAKDGTKTYFFLSENPKTTFKGNNLVITSESMSLSYSLDQVLRYTYELVPTGIESISQEKTVRISQRDDALTLENLKPGTTVSLYTVDGKLVMADAAGDSRSVTISLSDRPSGVYIVKANDVTYKMMKR